MSSSQQAEGWCLSLKLPNGRIKIVPGDPGLRDNQGPDEGLGPGEGPRPRVCELCQPDEEVCQSEFSTESALPLSLEFITLEIWTL